VCVCVNSSSDRKVTHAHRRRRRLDLSTFTFANKKILSKIHIIAADERAREMMLMISINFSECKKTSEREREKNVEHGELKEGKEAKKQKHEMNKKRQQQSALINVWRMSGMDAGTAIFSLSLVFGSSLRFARNYDNGTA
jgi:hypothetical protein